MAVYTYDMNTVYDETVVVRRIRKPVNVPLNSACRYPYYASAWS